MKKFSWDAEHTPLTVIKLQRFIPGIKALVGEQEIMIHVSHRQAESLKRQKLPKKGEDGFLPLMVGRVSDDQAVFYCADRIEEIATIFNLSILENN